IHLVNDLRGRQRIADVGGRIEQGRNRSPQQNLRCAVHTWTALEAQRLQQRRLAKRRERARNAENAAHELVRRKPHPLVSVILPKARCASLGWGKSGNEHGTGVIATAARGWG